MTEERKELYQVIEVIAKNRLATTKEEREGKYAKAWNKLIERLKNALMKTIKAEYLGRDFICDDTEFYCLYTTTDELNKYIGKAAGFYADTELTGLLLDDGAKMFNRLMEEQKALISQGIKMPEEVINNLKRNSKTYVAPVA